MTETSSTETASVSAVDQIAELLVEPEEKEIEAQDTDVEVETEEEAPAAELEAADEEEEQEVEEEEDVTWSGVLNVDDSKLVLDEDGNFKGVKVKVDGSESDVDLNTLITGYQTAKSTTQRSQALAEERKQFQDQSTQAVEKLKQRFVEADQLADVLQKKMISEYEGIDWPRLRAQNPAEYAATVTDFQQRKADIEQAKANIQQQYNNVASQQYQEAEAKRQQYIHEETKKTLDMFPEWRDPEAARADFTKMQQFIEKFGYKQDEFVNFTDSRAIALIKSAMGSEKSKVEAERKVAKPVPKFRKSTQTRAATRKQSKLDRLVKTAKSAKGANKRKAQTDAVTELLMNG